MQPWSDNQKCTDVYPVALEALAELVAVDLENTIIFHEAMRPDAKSDGWRMEDMAEDVVVGLVLVLIDLVKQLRVHSSPPLHCPLSPE